MREIMEILKTLRNNELTIEMTGRLETVTAPKLEETLKSSLQGVSTLIMDMKNLEYISSAGLRVLFSAQKTMNKQGEMIIRNVNEDVMEVFEITGSVDVLTIEKG